MEISADSKSASCTWFGTLNNPEGDAQEVLQKIHLAAKAVYTCGQLEKGESGTEHLQFYVNVGKNKQRFSFMKKVSAQAHWEVVRFNKAAEQYVMKEDTRIAGPWEFGEKPIVKQAVAAIKEKQKQRAELNQQIAEAGPIKAMQEGLISYKDVRAVYQSQQLIKLLAEQPVDMPEERGIWIWGPPRVGKSYLARNAWGERPYIKPQNKWWDGYNGQDTVLIEDLDDKGDCLGHLLKLWSDSYALEGEIKGATIALNYSRLVVTSNYSIEHIFGYDPEAPGMTEKKKYSANELVKALESRFKIIYINKREEQAHWMTHIHTLRPGKQRVMELKPPQEEEKKAHKQIAAIDRGRTIATDRKDVHYWKEQGKVDTMLGKRAAEASPYVSDSEMVESEEVPSSVNQSDIVDL